MTNLRIVKRKIEHYGGKDMKISSGARVGLIVEAIAFVWMIICFMRSVIVPDLVMNLFWIGLAIVFIFSIIEIRKQKRNKSSF